MWVVIPLIVFTKVTRPLIAVLNGSANQLLRLVGVGPVEELHSARTPDELASVVRRAGVQGALGSETAGLMERSLSFSAKTAADVMTPRTRVRTVSASSPVATVIEATRDSGRSRFPVIGDSVDDIRGVIHVKVAALIGESSEEGLLKSDQHELLTGALAFEETKAEAVGLPLDTLVTVDPDVTPGRVEQLVGQSRVA